MGKSIFSISVTSKLNRVMPEDIRKSVIGNPEMKKEILKVLQQANRRAQNIEKSNIVSPAYQALVLEGRTGFSKFKISGLDIGSENGWEKAKYEYAKAIEYLNNPTSSATGARQYINHIAKKYKVDKDTAISVIKMSTETSFIDNKIPFLNYRSMIDEYIQDSREENKKMNQSAKQRAKQLEDGIKRESKKIADSLNDVNQQLLDALTNGLKLF